MTSTPNRTSSPLLSLENAAARIRDRRLLSGTCWTLRSGQSWAVVGPNGAGKSTLAGLLLGTVPCVAGKVVRHVPEAAPDRIGHVSLELLEKMAQKESRLEAARQFSGRSGAAVTVRDLIGAGAADVPGFGVAPLMERAFSSLSTGELRRMLIARALCRRPGILVLDEPFEGLDREARKELKRSISVLIRSGKHVVLVTHRIENLVPGISHVLYVKDGRVSDTGPRKKMLAAERLARLFSLPGEAPVPPEPEGPLLPPPRGKAAPPLIEMQRVSVAYGANRVLENVDWVVRRGEHWAVLGPNGAGKTTLLSLISGDHLQAYANRISLFGKRRGTGESVWEIKKRMSLISSELQLRYRKPITAVEAVLSGFTDSVGLYRTVSTAERRTAERWLSFVGLADRADDRFDRLSYGERRRVLLARCMVKSPDLLILDEPCQGLDPSMRRRFLNLIDRIACGQIPSILYVTHHEEELPACIHRILRLDASAGTAPSTGRTEAVRRAPVLAKDNELRDIESEADSTDEPGRRR